MAAIERAGEHRVLHLECLGDRARRQQVELALQIASFPWRCVESDRMCIYEGLGVPLADALENEDRRGREVIFDPGFAAGVQRFTDR